MILDVIEHGSLSNTISVNNSQIVYLLYISQSPPDHDINKQQDLSDIPQGY